MFSILSRVVTTDDYIMIGVQSGGWGGGSFIALLSSPRVLFSLLICLTDIAEGITYILFLMSIQRLTARKKYDQGYP